MTILAPYRGKRPLRSHWAMRDLELWWLFNEGIGTYLHDYSGNANHGDSWSATPDWTQFTDYGRSLGFNGSSEAIESDTGGLDVTANWTAHARVYPTSTASDRIFLMWGDAATNEGPHLSISGGNWRAAYWGGGTADGGTPAANTWATVVGTYDGTNVNLYVDGEFVTSAATSTAAASSTVVRIGSSVSAGFRAWFEGALQDVRLWSRLLTEEEIRALYQDPYAPFRETTRRTAVFVQPQAEPLVKTEIAPVQRIRREWERSLVLDWSANDMLPGDHPRDRSYKQKIGEVISTPGLLYYPEINSWARDFTSGPAIAFPSLQLEKPFTCIVLINFDATGGTICGERDGTDYRWQFWDNAANLRLRYGNGADIAGNTSVNTGVWYWAGCNMDSGNAATFAKLAGNNYSTGTLSYNNAATTQAISGSGPNPVAIGARWQVYPTTSFADNSKIARVLIWDRYLSQNEVDSTIDMLDSMLKSPADAYTLFEETAAVTPSGALPWGMSGIEAGSGLRTSGLHGIEHGI